MYASSRKTTWTLLYTIQVFWFPQPNECVSEKFPQGDILLKGRHHMPLCVFNRKAEPWHNQHQRSRCVKCRSTKPYKSHLRTGTSSMTSSSTPGSLRKPTSYSNDGAENMAMTWTIGWKPSDVSWRSCVRGSGRTAPERKRVRFDADCRIIKQQGIEPLTT